MSSPFGYLAEEFGDFLIVDVAQQEIVGQHVSDRHILLTFLVGARVLRIALRQPSQVLQQSIPIHATPSSGCAVIVASPLDTGL
jgi:hypothetical protein